MDKNLIIVIVLALLVVVSLVQAFELNSLRTSVSGVQFSTASGTQSSSQASSAPSSVLPTQVGGCG